MKSGTAVAVCVSASAVAGALYVLWRMTDCKKTKPLKVGVLGTGWGIKVQLPQFRKAGLDVTALYSRDPARAAALAEVLGVLHPFSDPAALAQCPDVELVSIVTPPCCHAKQFEEAMVAGKHVLVDKPMCMDSAEARRMLEVAKERPQQVAIVDHELRFTPYMLRARQLVRDGALGVLCHLRMDVWVPSARGTWTWWADEAQGGGALGAIGTHCIDAARFLLGAEVASVSAHLATVQRQLPEEGNAQPGEVTADDYCSVAMVLEPRRGSIPGQYWGDGKCSQSTVQCQMTMTMGGAPPMGRRYKPSILLIGSEGSLELDHFNSTLALYGSKGQLLRREGGGGSAFAVVGTQALGKALQRALGPERDSNALRDAATIKDGLAVMQVVDAIRQSAMSEAMWVAPARVDDVPAISSRPVAGLDHDSWSPTVAGGRADGTPFS